MALRHSTRQADTVYDRRTTNERVGEAVRLAREYAEESFCHGQAEAASKTESVDHEFQLGQFVGLTEKDSTEKRPKVLVAQVHRLLTKGRVSLLRYKPHKNLFRLELDGEDWIEHANCLVPVAMQPAPDKPGWFRLEGSLRAIHNSVHGRGD